MVYKKYDNHDEYLNEYKKYAGDKCDKCGGVRELNETEIYCNIGFCSLHFPSIFTLKCEKCGDEVLPQYTKKIIDGAYKNMLNENRDKGLFTPTDFKKKFYYCEKEDFEYDHKDYYNVPGLRYDDEHAIEGFLTPVYFDKLALVYFLNVPDYQVDIFSETYGNIAKKDSTGNFLYEWSIPFGFNRNGLLIMWLGDAMMVSVIYMVIQFVICIVTGVIGTMLSFKVALIINFVVCIIMWILIMMLGFAKDHVQRIDSRQKNHHTEL